MLQPRLAMTAAMAFFSIALTMDLTGVRLQDLRTSDLRPSSLKRDFYSANARVVQYYEGLRVVYELESRVHDLQSAADSDAPAGTQTAPARNLHPSQPKQRQPAALQMTPSNNPARSDSARTSLRQPAAAPTAPSRARPNPGTSRREDLNSDRHVCAASTHAAPNPAKAERTLA